MHIVRRISKSSSISSPGNFPVVNLSFFLLFSSTPRYDTDDPTGPDDDITEQQVHMAHFYDACQQLFQIASTNNWQDIM